MKLILIDVVNNGCVEIVIVRMWKEYFFGFGGNMCFVMFVGVIYVGVVEDYINVKFMLGEWL